MLGRLRIRNINPLTATYQCRFFVFMEWFDPSAVGMPLGDVSEAGDLQPYCRQQQEMCLFEYYLHSLPAQENRKKLSIPEIALQNTLKTGSLTGIWERRWQAPFRDSRLLEHVRLGDPLPTRSHPQ